MCGPEVKREKKGFCSTDGGYGKLVFLFIKQVERPQVNSS